MYFLIVGVIFYDNESFAIKKVMVRIAADAYMTVESKSMRMEEG